MSQHLWLLLSALLVFLMQAGFLCLESGRTRSKNSINVAAKNVSDFIISAAMFWLFGFALMFGDSLTGFLGLSEFFFGEEKAAYDITFFLFQMMFCGTTATLTSGAVAERASFLGYLLITFILSAFIYPVTGHWAWAGAYHANNDGWLQELGFVDFAGSTVVHSVGGWVALSAVIIIGPRLGRYESGVTMPTGSNLPMAALGTLLIWFGWFGFNGGSTLSLNEQVPLILLNTSLSAIFACLVAATISYLIQGYICVTYLINGIISGLVAITAACHAVAPFEAAIIGCVSGLVLYWGNTIMDRFRLDDALAVVPAHLFAGAWGTLAVALFGDTALLGTGLTFGQQLLVQSAGIVVIGVYSFSVSYLLMRLVNAFVPLRVSAEDEMQGLNVAEHKAKTELIDLLGSMEKQQSQGNFTAPVHEEPFTEVGQIAHKYNQVIARVNREMYEKDSAIQQFRISERQKSAILESSMDSIVSIDRLGNIVEFNYAAERTFGCQRRQVQGQSFIENFVLESERPTIMMSLKQKFSSSQGLILNRRNTLTLQRSSEQPFPAEVTITSTASSDYIDSEYTLHIRDITKHVKLQNRLKFLAYSDPLTRLANRTYLLEQLSVVMKSLEETNTSVAIIFMDLDKFKKINDTLGHKAGDELLCEVAKRLTKISRETDVVARWGGDEFILMLAGDVTVEAVCKRAEVILSIMRNPIQFGEKSFSLPTSIGIAVNSGEPMDAELLIQHADIAMYTAKQLGRDNYQVFTPEMADKASRSFSFEQEMREGMDADEFFVAYQPKVVGNKDRIIGLEGLIRWNHPRSGLISPDEFIPVAEESNLIIQLGEMVIIQVLNQLKEWKEEGMPLVPVALNISGRQLVSGDLVPFVREQLEHFDMDGKFLEFEITEGVLLNDITRCIEVMRELKAMNVSLSIDDFGTGYSSLNYLKRLPIDVLKIDQSFVKECDTEDEDYQICATIINLAKNLGISTVAEGVEKEEHWKILTDLGCTVFQGYYFYQPMKEDEIKNLMTSAAVLATMADATN